MYALVLLNSDNRAVHSGPDCNRSIIIVIIIKYTCAQYEKKKNIYIIFYYYIGADVPFSNAPYRNRRNRTRTAVTQYPAASEPYVARVNP